jgi:hypothetical protein
MQPQVIDLCDSPKVSAMKRKVSPEVSFCTKAKQKHEHTTIEDENTEGRFTNQTPVSSSGMDASSYLARSHVQQIIYDLCNSPSNAAVGKSGRAVECQYSLTDTSVLNNMAVGETENKENSSLENSAPAAPVFKYYTEEESNELLARLSRNVTRLGCSSRAMGIVMSNSLCRYPGAAVTPPPNYTGEPVPAYFPTTIAAIKKLTAKKLVPIEDYYEMSHEGTVDERMRRVAWHYGAHLGGEEVEDY